MASTGKRKRVALDLMDHNAIDKENLDTNEQQPVKKKQAKLPASAKTTKTSTKSQPSNSSKEATKLYTDTLKAIDKGVAELDRKVKRIGRDLWALTTSDYAKAASQYVDIVGKLAKSDPVLAFNLLLSLADASHTDLDATPKMCGEPFDESTPTFRKLDQALLPLIEAREAPKQRVDVLPPVPHRWKRSDADVGEFKTGRPNKQQWNQMYAQKLEWDKERRAARRARREVAEDWVAVALADLKEERDYLAAYGVEGYLPLSIAKLESLKA